MPKNIEDIIPSGRRSVKDIPIPIRKTKSAAEASAPAKKLSEPVEIPLKRLRSEPEEEVMERAPRRRSKTPRTKLYAGLGIGVLASALIIFSLMSGAKLAYVPKTAELEFSADTYVAHQSASNGELSYSVVKLSGERSTNVPASGEETVSEKASGRIVVYNEQVSAQRLVKTTRFETTEGLIFRTPSDVTVPAKGNIEITVVADQAGPSYNVGLSDFTVPGLKGSAAFDKVYARSKTPMTGGFTGTRKKVSEEDLAKAKTTLDAELKSELLTQARAQMPSDFVLFPDLATFTYTLLPQGTSTGSSATVRESGDLVAVIFKRSELAQYLALQKLGQNNVKGEVEIPDYSDLHVTLFGTPPADLSKVTAIRIQIDGAAVARFVTDEASLAADLAGQEKDSVNDILKSYPSIEKATAMIRPFWKSTFPTDATKINIERQD